MTILHVQPKLNVFIFQVIIFAYSVHGGAVKLDSSNFDKIIGEKNLFNWISNQAQKDASACNVCEYKIATNVEF